MSTGIITFTRNKKKSTVAFLDDDEPTSPSALSTPPGGRTSAIPAEENQPPSPDSRPQKGQRNWRRKGVPTVQEKREATRKAVLEDMRSFYDNVDAFDLLVETPTPPQLHPKSKCTQNQGCEGLNGAMHHPPLCRRSGRISGETPLKLSKTFLHTVAEDDEEEREQRLPQEPPPREAWGHAPTLRPTPSSHPQGRDRNSLSSVFKKWFSFKGPLRSRLWSFEKENQEEARAMHNANPPKKVSPKEKKKALETLASLCGYETVQCPGEDRHGEEARLDVPLMDKLFANDIGIDITSLRKIGEGTFGEVFKSGHLVFKIVPIEGTTPGGIAQKRAEDILSETAVTLTLGRLSQRPIVSGKKDDGESAPEKKDDGESAPENAVLSGFLHTHGLALCKGTYADALQKEWNAWNARKKSENEPVKNFTSSQLYGVFVAEDGGRDLEHFELRSGEEIKAVLLQTVLALAVAEDACEFEHRDLHWGNMLVKRTRVTQQRYRWRGVDIEAQTGGLQVTLIDFTLSRVRDSDRESIYYCDLNNDPEIFKGPKGDIQAETYRKMLRVTRGKWHDYTPKTNVLWLEYVCDMCLMHKGGHSDDGNRKEKKALKDFRKRLASYGCAGDVVWDSYFAGRWVSCTQKDIIES